MLCNMSLTKARSWAGYLCIAAQNTTTMEMIEEWHFKLSGTSYTGYLSTAPINSSISVPVRSPSISKLCPAISGMNRI